MGLRKRWWLGLLLLLLSAFAQGQECQHRLEVPGGSDRLVLLEQPGIDLRVVDPQSGYKSAGPKMNYGLEIVLIEAQSDQRTLCLEPIYHGVGELPVVSYSTVRLQSALDLELGTRLAEAFRLWHEDTEVARQTAIQHFLDFADQVPASNNLELIELAPLAIYLAAEGNRQRFQYHKVEPLLAELYASEAVYLRYAAQKSLAYLISFNPERRAEARVRLERVIAMAKEHFQSDLAEHYAHASLPYLLEGDLENGERLLRLGESVSMDRPINIARIYNNLGWLSKLHGDREQTLKGKISWYLQSIEEHALAADKARAAGDSNLLSLVLKNKGTIQDLLGDDYGAVESYREALLVIDGIDSARARSSSLRALANAYLSLGDYKKAFKYYELVYQRYEKTDGRFAATVNCNLGRAYRETGDFRRSLDSYQQCEQMLNGRDLQANIGMGRTYVALADWRNAQTHLQIAREIMAASSNTAALDRFNDDANMARTSANEALVLAHLGALEQARMVAEEAESFVEVVLSHQIKLEIYRPLMRTYIQLGDPEKAIDLGYAAIELIEQVYAGLEPERVGPAWSERSSDIFKLLIELVVTEGVASEKDLLQLIERSRATNLRLRLNAHNLGLTASIQESSNEHLDKIAELANQRALAPEQVTFRQFYQQELFFTQNPTQLQAVVAPPDILDVQRKLAPGQLAVVYEEVANQWIRFLVSHTELKYELIASQTDLFDLASAFTRGIRERDPGWRELAKPLAPLLTDIDWQGVEILVVIARGQLETLPWQALFAAQNVPDTVSAITAPSLSVLTTGDSVEHRDLSTQVAIFANPLLNGLDRDETSLWSATLQPLPWSEREAANIQSHFPQGQVRTYLAEQATRATFLSPEVRNAHVLHIATHGFYSSTDKDNVGFVLTDEKGRGRGSFITLSDIYANRFNSRLVVVSGCETGIGQQFKGEGANSLARAFIAQGAANVISTYWKVSDRASASFMKLLYEELKTTGDIAVAFARAQQRLKRDRRFRHPYFWAAYNLHSRGMEYSVAF